MYYKTIDTILDYKLKALSDETRREILCFLKKGRKCAGEIAERFPVSAPSISYYLSILSKSRLISSHRDKGFIVYELNSEELNNVIDWIRQFDNHMEE